MENSALAATVLYCIFFSYLHANGLAHGKYLIIRIVSVAILNISAKENNIHEVTIGIQFMINH